MRDFVGIPQALTPLIFPIFDDVAMYDTKLPSELYNAASYSEQMKMASRELSEAINNGGISPSRFTSTQLQQIKNGSAKIDGYTWHHHQDSGRMQLVPEIIHNNTRHVGGNAMQQGR